MSAPQIPNGLERRARLRRICRPLAFAMILLLILAASGCVDGASINSRRFGFNKGVTGAAAEPINNEIPPIEGLPAGQPKGDPAQNT